jgi:hypothetical protein
MKRLFGLVMVAGLVCAGSSRAGILLNPCCHKAPCPCAVYGGFFGYFPTAWRAWPTAVPETSPQVGAAAAPTPGQESAPRVMPPLTMTAPSADASVVHAQP